MDRRRGGGFAAITAASALLIGAHAARAGDHHAPRPLPANAVIPPGVNLHQPDVEREQAVRIVREGLRATFAALFRTPARASARLAGRGAERLAVRARELAMTGAMTCPIHIAGRCACRPASGEDLGGGVGGPPTAARLTYLPGSEPAVRSLLGLIAAARSRIDFMIYGWEDDPTGREVAAALAARARGGPRPPAGGPHRLPDPQPGRRPRCPHLPGRPPRDAQRRADRAAGHLLPLRPPEARGHRRPGRLDGGDDPDGVRPPLLAQLRLPRRGPHRRPVRGPLRRALAGAGRRPAGPEPPPPAVATNAVVRLLRTDLGGERTLKEAIYHAVDHARRHIYLENPYFADEILSRKLAAAAARGVDVRAVLTLRNNVARLGRFETLVANRLLRDGGHVYLYPKMTHVKALSVDGTWAYIGTGNFDELSLRNNREVGLAVATPSAVVALDQALFRPDMAASEALTDLLPPPSARERVRLFLLALWY